MLKSISISNYALIDQLDVTWDAGLNVITGETGAGKSIVIDALTLILGQRADRQNIRAGETKMSVQGVFVLSPDSPVRRRLSDMAIEIGDDDLIITRAISATGHNTCRVNGFAVTVSQLKDLGRDLVDIHSQHENNSLFQSDAQRRLLDAWAGAEVTDLLEQTRSQAAKLKTLSKKIRTQEKDDRELERRKEMITFELSEIRGAKLTPEEEPKLQKQQKLLANAEMLFSASGEAKNLLDGISDEGGIIDDLSRVAKLVGDLGQIDERFAPYRRTVSDAEAGLSDLSIELGNFLSELAFDPGQLDQVEGRLAVIEGLRRKYGETIPEIIRYGQKLEQEYDELIHHDDRLKEMQRAYKTLWKNYRDTAAALHKVRIKAAESLSQAIEKELADLAMPRARFDIDVEEDEKIIAPWGNDRITFRISVNPGTPLRALKDVASGGEMSRIMLAVKCLFGALDEMETMIFDEIDTGISGRTAQVVAEKIMQLSRSRQVITITHLPQITAMADAHFRVEKAADDDSTQVSFTPLSDDERVDELARMLSGAKITDLSRQTAGEMIAQSTAQKKQFDEEASQ